MKRASETLSRATLSFPSLLSAASPASDFRNHSGTILVLKPAPCGTLECLYNELLCEAAYLSWCACVCVCLSSVLQVIVGVLLTVLSTSPGLSYLSDPSSYTTTRVHSQCTERREFLHHKITIKTFLWV